MKPWYLIDTETDGLSHPVHIIEIAIQKFEGLSSVGRPVQLFLNHGIEIPPEATAIHGYTTEFIREKGVSPANAYAAIREVIGSDNISSHFLSYDWDRALVPELMRLQEKPIGKRGLCTWLLSRRALPEHTTHRLDYLRQQYDLGCSREHSAAGDVESTVDLLTRIVFPRLKKIGFDSIEKVEEFSKITPVLKCRCLIEGLDYEEEARKITEAKAQRKKLEAFIRDVECGSYSLPKLILDLDLIEENCVIEFKDRTFLFTGKMRLGSRTMITGEIEKRGGVGSKSKSITADLDYLVLGEDEKLGWTSLTNGSKLTKAFLKRFKAPHLKYKIVREEDFVSALRDI